MVPSQPDLSGFVRLRGAETSHCSLHEEDRQRADETWRCSGCGGTKRGVGPVDVRIKEQRPADDPITFINGSVLGLVRLDLLDALRAGEELFVGSVRNGDGEVLPDWATVHGKHKIIVRGTRNVSHRVCSVCDRNVYFAMGTEYLFREPLPAVDIFDEGGARLVVRSLLLERFDVSRWPRLRVQTIKVFRRPKDGLGLLV